MDEKWAEEGRGVGMWEKGGNWRALPADMNGEAGGGDRGDGGRDEVKDERRGTGEWGIRIATEEYKNRRRNRNGEGGMPEINGLIQDFSSMEFRACQIACNQQSSPLSDGGIMHVDGKQHINAEWSFCSADVAPLHLTRLVDETVFTPTPWLTSSALHPNLLQPWFYSLHGTFCHPLLFEQNSFFHSHEKCMYLLSLFIE